MEFVEFESIAESIISTITGDIYYSYLWLALVVGGVCYAVVYSFKAVGLYTIAKRGGYKNTWMAFVPFVNTYYIGVLSDKNRLFKAKPKYYSLAFGVLEFIHFVLELLVIIATFMLFAPGACDIRPNESIISTMGGELSYFNGTYTFAYVPDRLQWALVVFSIFPSYINAFVELACIALQVFVLSAFFRTYNPAKYLLFTILSVLFPLQGVFIFCVRNRNGVNYIQYMQEYQRRRYAAYQEYMRNNPGGYGRGGYGGYNGYNGGYGNGYNNGYNNGSGYNRTPPEDPFGGMGANNGGNSTSGNSSGSSSDGNSDDPFDLS